MNERRGHINSSAEMSRIVGNIANQNLSGQAMLQREFSQTIGQRTFEVIRNLGVAEKNTFLRPNGNSERALSPFNTVLTSKELEFQLPDSQTDYGLRFELDSQYQLARLPWIRPIVTLGAAAELNTKTQQSRAHIDYENYQGDKGIEMSFGGMKITQTGGSHDTGKIKSFDEVLSFAEAIIQGETPREIPSSLQFRN